MEITAYTKNIRMSPRKLQLVANRVKKMDLQKALVNLAFLNKRSSSPILKTIKSAMSNATNNFKLLTDNLKIKNIIVEEGLRAKRMDRGHGARFNRGVIKKRSSHIKVILTDKK